MPKVSRLPYSAAGSGQRAALAQAVPSSAEREEVKHLRAELKRVEIERNILKKAVTIFALPQS